MSEVVEAGCGAGAVCMAAGGEVGVLFFLPIPKKPRFVFVAGEEGACLLSRNDPTANVAPCAVDAPLVCPLVTPALAGPEAEGFGASTSSSRSVESPSSSPALRGMPRTGVRSGGSSYGSGSESESSKRLANRLGRASSSSLESAKRLVNPWDLAGADGFPFGCLASVVGFCTDLGSAGTGGSSLTFLRNRPPGDRDLMLNLDDFTGSGEAGLMD